MSTVVGELASVLPVAAGAGDRLKLIANYGAGVNHIDLKAARARGLGVEEILTVNASPGFSEHHGGRALDGTPAAISVVAATRAWKRPGFMPMLSNQPAVPGIRPPPKNLL